MLEEIKKENEKNIEEKSIKDIICDMADKGDFFTIGIFKKDEFGRAKFVDYVVMASDKKNNIPIMDISLAMKRISETEYEKTIKRAEDGILENVFKK